MRVIELKGVRHSAHKFRLQKKLSLIMLVNALDLHVVGC